MTRVSLEAVVAPSQQQHLSAPDQYLFQAEEGQRVKEGEGEVLWELNLD